jgi:hypothetical protein
MSPITDPFTNKKYDSAKFKIDDSFSSEYFSIGHAQYSILMTHY